ncbi:MAG: penicillin acylase family protein [Actinomycetota bacterium]
MTASFTVIRDRWGIGHVRADHALDAFRAQGWLAAADRIWQMEWDRLRAQGRWASVVGPSAVAEDRVLRRLGIAAAARRDLAALDDGARAMVEAYSAGVNEWLVANAGNLPAEFVDHPDAPEPWEPWHCLAVYKVRHLYMGTLHRKLWRAAVTRRAGGDVVAAMVGDPAAASAMVPGHGDDVGLLDAVSAILTASEMTLAGLPDVDGASNSWAIAGSRTATGAPLLAGDPHRGIEFPNVYHQCHVTCDEFDAIGLAFPGVPGFAHFGHNDDVAWCITHGMADDTDLFVEPPTAITDRRVERIEVRGAEAVDVVCASTPRGPVVLGDPDGTDPVLSMAYTGLGGAGQADTTVACLRPMLSASNVEELEVAVADWVIPVNNLLTADRAGTISFLLRGRLIDRPAANRWGPVPGTDEHAWQPSSVVPFEAMPRWRDPDRGFLVTANNRISERGPYVSLDFAGPSRHDRIVELLGDLTAATSADMATIHADVRSLVAPDVLARLAGATPATDLGRAALGLLDGWDHEMAADSAAATVYAATRNAWHVLVVERLGLDDLTTVEAGWPSAVLASRYTYEGASRLLVGDGWRLVPGLDDQTLATELGALVDSVAADLAAELGPDPETWRWDRVHTMVSPHPLASARPGMGHLHPPTDGVAGDGDTVRCASINPASGLGSAAGSVARYVFDLSDWDASGWVVPHGVSGRRDDGHDLDQRATWLACELLPMLYSPTALAANTMSTEVVEASD